MSQSTIAAFLCLAFGLVMQAHTAEPGAKSPAVLAVACKWDDSVSFFDAATGQPELTVAIGKRPHEMALSHDGTAAYVTLYGTDFYYDDAEGGRTVAILDVKARRKVTEIDLGVYRRPHGIEVGHKSGLLFVTCDRPAALLVIDPQKKAVITEIRIAEAKALPHMVAVAADERTAFVANCGTGDVSVIDLSAKKESMTIPIGGVPMGMALTADGRTLFATNRTANGVAIIDTTQKKVRRIIEISGQPVRAALTPDQRWLLVTLIDSGELAVVDVAREEVVRRLPVGARVEGMLIDPAGEHVYAGAQADNKVVKYSLNDWRTIYEIKTGQRPDPMLLIGGR